MRKHLDLVVAMTVPALLFFALPPLGAAGVLEPQEVRVADLAERAAQGARPALAELGRLELPFTSIACATGSALRPSSRGLPSRPSAASSWRGSQTAT